MASESELISTIERLEGRLAAYTDISNGKDMELIRYERENENLKKRVSELEREKETLMKENEAFKNRKVVRLVDGTKEKFKRRG